MLFLYEIKEDGLKTLMRMDRVDKLQAEIKELEETLKDREKALPAHSIRPHQLLIIEELEEALEKKKTLLQEHLKGKEGNKHE
jgi:hypothetical protein